MSEYTMLFGQLESILAEANDIRDEKRTAFQSRLKNFHRLNYPPGLEMAKGKATIYRPRDVIRMALAVQLAQMGLGPERSIAILTNNGERSIAFAVHYAALAIQERPRGTDEFLEAEKASKDLLPKAYYLVFDPLGLEKLARDKQEHLRDKIVAPMTAAEVVNHLENITVSLHPRLAIINVTQLMDWTSPQVEDGDDSRTVFLNDCIDWSEKVMEGTKRLGDGDT